MALAAMALTSGDRPWWRLGPLRAGRPDRPTRPMGGATDPDTAAALAASDVGADWTWTPEAFRQPLFPPGHAGLAPGLAVGQGLQVFHDCPLCETTLRQRVLPADLGKHTARGTADTALGLVLETLHFRGSYLSLAVTLPTQVARGLTPEHILSLDAQLRQSPPGEVFLRLNLRHGPNTATLTRQPPWGEENVRMAFDLAAMRFDPGRITGAWIDLIFDRPAMTRCEVNALVLSRRLRATL